MEKYQQKYKFNFNNLYRYIFNLPKSIRIEASSLCNLHCKDCYMRNNNIQTIIGNGYLKFDDYKKFIDKHKFIENIEISLSGEIFSNPDLIKIIEYSYKKGIKLTAFNGVNFNNVSDEMLEALVKYKFAGITFSIDGTCQETYSLYRIGGNYDKVIENIKKLNDYKQKYKSNYPVLVWQFIVFKHNINEIQQAQEIAEKLGMVRIHYKEAWNKEVDFNNINLYSRIIPLNNYKDLYVKELLKENDIEICEQLWKQPQINWDGRLLGCCCSIHHDLGINVFDIGLKKALKSSKYIAMVNSVKGKSTPNNEIDCYSCQFYQKLKRLNKFF